MTTTSQRYKDALFTDWHTLLAPHASTRGSDTVQFWSRCGLYRVVRVAFKTWQVYQHPTPGGRGAVVVLTTNASESDPARAVAVWLAREEIEPDGGEA